MARLTIKLGSKVENVLELDIKELIIGRGSDCQLELENDLVSRNHCKVKLVDGGFVLEDMGSTTGTFVNKSRIQAHVLQQGDEIGIGPYTLVYTGSVDVEETEADEKAADTGAFWAQAAADSGIVTGTHAGAKTAEEQAEDEGPAVPASALGPRGDGAKDLDDYQGTMLASADEMARIRAGLEVSQRPHLVIRKRGKARKIPLEEATFEVGFTDDADFRLDGSRLFGKRQFVIREVGDANYEVTPLSWWASVQLNGERIRSRGKLNDGSVIQAAGVKFRFKTGD